MISKSDVVIVKANGDREPFNPEKLYQSLVRSGAAMDVAGAITTRVADSLRDGDRTKDIYTRAFAALRQLERPMAARYSVKRALLELGPSGYPFEDFIAEIYRALGYAARTRVVVRGKCVEHELDMVATRNEEQVGAEAKYHNSVGIKSDLKVALYVQARFEDLANGGAADTGPYTTRLLITNTKFSTQAELYAACVGLELVSWDHPKRGNLRHLIEETRVHPVSCLTSLSTVQKRRLMERDIVLCRSIVEHRDELEALGLSDAAAEAVLAEAADLCGTA
jgi:hypothetical protein